MNKHVREIEVHPLANIFPMLPDEALADLAEDIKANGLRVPILVTHDGKLLDGRNRLAACKMAGFEPEFEQLAEGADPLAAVVSLKLLNKFKTQGEAIAWAKNQGHTVHVARVRHLSDKRNPDHWRKAV